MEMEKLINTLNELSAELATQPETWKQMAIIKAISTIEALQQENEQLQVQVARMRTQLEIIKENIHEFPPEGMTIGKEIWLKTTDAAISDTHAEYHNPADVAEIEQRGEWIDQQATKILRQQAVLKRAREALDEVNNYSGYEQGFDHDSLLDEVEEAIAAIDKIGGREDV